MHLFKVEKEWNSSIKKFPIIFMGDFHAGSVNCDYTLLKQHVDEIKELDNASVILMGDMAEWIVQGDRRFKPKQIDKRFHGNFEDLPMAYLKYLTELLEPIADKIEVVHDGNHEKSMFPYMYPGSVLCEMLRSKLADKYSPEFARNKLRYAQGEAYTKFVWKWNGVNSDYRTWTVNTAHGWQAGRQAGAKHNEMAKVFAWIGADACFRGHSHELFAEYGSPKETPNPQMTKIVETTVIYGHTGSYLKAREITETSNYAEDGGYRPLPRGNVQIEISLNDKGVDKEIKIRSN